MPREPFALSHGNVHIVPVCHERVEFARYVREAVRQFAPLTVAVELPPEVGQLFEQAVDRFPSLSYIANRPPSPEAEGEPGESFVFYRVEPSDPLAEAVRSGREAGARIAFVDVYREDYPEIAELIPDSYSVHHLGLERFWRLYQENRVAHDDDGLDQLRERHMAYRVQQLSAHGSVLLVCGMAHAQGVLEALRQDTAELAASHTVSGLKIYQPTPETVRSLSGEMPLVMTLYEFVRGGPGPDETWHDPEPEDEDEAPASGELLGRKARQPRSPFEGHSAQDAVASLESLLGLKGDQEEKIQLSAEELKAIHRILSGMGDPRLTLSGLTQSPEDLPQIEGAPQLDTRRLRAFKFRTCEERRSELHGIYGHLNGECRDADRFLDRQKVLLHLFVLAGEFYEENTGETFKRWQHKVLNQFSRNYARLTGQLLPSLYQLVMAARGCVDHNYAYELWDLATFYPWSHPPDSAPSLHISGEGIEIDGIRFKKWRFHRRFPRLRERLKPMPVPNRGQEDRPGEWSDALDSGHICSYPPEDIVIEDYGRYLQRKAVLTMSEEKTRVEPFTTSLLDGIDMRTTLRKWADGQKIFVRETQRAKGGTGSVVIIFDEDKSMKKYPWMMTWHGEHQQESDMAFYATHRTHKVIGPGIARCEYGGLMLTYPPRRLMDVWSDPYYQICQTKAEVLLFAALDYCLERHVVYVAAQPPRTLFRSIAGKLGKKIVYLPIGGLSPVSLKKIRVFHVLSGHHLRKIAKDYIW